MAKATRAITATTITRVRFVPVKVSGAGSTMARIRPGIQSSCKDKREITLELAHNGLAWCVTGESPSMRDNAAAGAGVVRHIVTRRGCPLLADLTCSALRRVRQAVVVCVRRSRRSQPEHHRRLGRSGRPYRGL